MSIMSRTIQLAPRSLPWILAGITVPGLAIVAWAIVSRLLQ